MWKSSWHRRAFPETIRGRVKTSKANKTDGGKGQFGCCYLIWTRRRGTGLVFEDAIVGGSIPRQFISIGRKGIKSAWSVAVGLATRSPT